MANPRDYTARLASASAGAGGAPGVPTRPMDEEDLASHADAPPDYSIEDMPLDQFLSTYLGLPPPPPPPPPPPQEAPRPVVRRAPPRPPLPPELQGQYGGRYYPPDFVDRLDLEDLSPEQQEEASRALEGYEQFRRGPYGLAQRERQLSLQGETVKAETRSEQAAAEARGEAKAAGLEAERAAFLGEEHRNAQERAQRMQEAAREYEARIQAADQRVAEYRIEDRREMGQRVLDGIAAALGALGEGLAGIPNRALDIIESRIQRDFESQREELNSLREQGKEARNDLSAYYDQYGDMEQARAAFTERKLQEYESALQSTMSQMRSDRARAKAGEVAKLLPIAQQQARLRGEQLAYEGQERARAAAAAAAAAQAKREQRAKVLQQMQGYEPVGDDEAKLFVGDGFAMPGTSPEVIKELREDYANVAKVNNAAARLRANLAKGAGGVVDPQTRAEMDQDIALLTTAVAKGYGGTITEGDMEQAKREIGGDPTAISERALRDVSSLVGRFQATTNAQREAKLRASGARPADVVPLRDPFAEDPLEARVRYFKRERGLGQEQRSNRSATVIKPGAARGGGGGG